ncbi:DNA-processing protein DprA [Propionibacteriaceae bacterium G57]|uniref:DNA-processing protein DprA n=1 Tax=Aestuariimicrobium sp. G57 TaxID=3418485 RepID=UPI003DA752D3
MNDHDTPHIDDHPGHVRATWDDDRLARAHLSGVVEPASLDLARLVADHGATHVWGALQRGDAGKSRWSRLAGGFDLRASLALCPRDDLRYVVPTDEDWPAGLQALAHVEHEGLGGAPLGLWVLGPQRPDEVLAGSVAVVGSRAATHYGQQVAAALGAELSAAGRTVVSGGAYGIDAAAHTGALVGPGTTAAILAHGLDQWYPRGNHQLLEQVSRLGIACSEVAPGGTPTKVGFLGRNRLLAAVSTGTVLVEAAQRSGALNTVAWAHKLLRQVMAVPGPVTSALSLGPHRQVRDGLAVLVTGAADVLDQVGSLQPELVPPAAAPRLLDLLDPTELAVREALPGRGSRSVDDLAARTGFAVPEVLGSLTSLEAGGLARRRPDGSWALARPKGAAAVVTTT